MTTVRICGVPEHFNLPWHFAIEEGAFEERGIQLEWTDIPEGTGRMAKMLNDGETDLAIILTEGIVKSISDGNPSKIVQTYIASPLLWGIHVDGKSTLTTVTQLKNKKAAISRLGSGSHLMAFVQAQRLGWEINELQFEVVNHLEGAITALGNQTADYFMWEHFTTKPLVDNGTFASLGDLPTPWPCFVIAGNETFLSKNSRIIRHILEIINSYTLDFKHIPSIDRTFSNRYNQRLEDIQTWLSLTKWSQKQLATKDLIQVINMLKSLKLLGALDNPNDFFWEE